MQNILQSLQSIYLCKYRISFVAKDVIKMPGYKGFSFRDNFWEAVYRLVRCHKNKKPLQCEKCKTRSECIYTWTFNPIFPDDNQYKRRYVNSPPHSFIIDSLDLHKSDFLPGETLALDFSLIGKANDYLHEIIAVFKEMGDIGIGSRSLEKLERGKYILHAIETLDYTGKKQIISVGENILDNVNPYRINLAEANKFPEKCNNVTLDFTSPLALMSKEDKENPLTTGIDFSVIRNRLAERVCMLANLYCDTHFEDFEKIQPLVNSISLSKEHLIPKEFTYTSRRQGKTFKYKSCKGSISYTGVLDAYLPLLYLGSFLHIGKHTASGFGKYSFEYDSTPKV